MNQRINLGIFGLLMLSAAGLAEAAVCTSLSTGRWDRDARWDCGHVPLQTDTVVIAHNNVDMRGDYTVAGLTINDLAVLDDAGKQLTSTGNVIINGTFGVNGGGGDLLMGSGTTISGNGMIDDARLEVEGNVTLSVGAVLNFKNGANILVSKNAATTFTVNGAITAVDITAGQTILKVDNKTGNKAIINGSINAPSANIEIQQGGTVQNNGSVSITYLDGNGDNPVTWTQGVNSTLTLSQPTRGWNNGTFTASESGNTVTYNGTSTVITPSPAEYWNLAGSIFPASCPVAHTISGTNPCLGAPAVTTNAATALTSGGATLNGTVSSNGASTTVTFDYGLTTGYGSTATATASPLAANAANTAVSAAVTGLTCGTTYHFRAKGVNPGTTNGSDLTFSTSACAVCAPPSNIPVGVSVTCQCDDFVRGTLNPSTIFNSNWVASTSDTTGILPSIVNSGYLRLTNNTGNNAKAATVPGIFPATGNYISVEFKQYAYNGSGADGVAVTLSDYAVPAVPGAFGGSLGYAQRTGVVGFAGGWIGVALDEFGNYQNPTEGRLGGAGFIVQSVGMRGSGSGMNGYNFLAGTAALNPTIDNKNSTTPSRGYYYQVIVDARSEPTSTLVAVNRDTTGTGNSYISLISIPNVYTAAAAKGFTQSPVPSNWQISFTGSTGGSTNIHEIGSLRICASTMVPPSGGTAGSFSAIDEAYGVTPLAVQNYLSGRIYTKMVGTPFKFNVAALSNSQIVTTYAAASAKTVTVKLVDNSDSLADPTKDCTLSCSNTCTSKAAVTGGTQTLTFAAGSADKGQKQSPSFTLNSAYQKLVAIISDGTTSACSIDAFSVRPLSIASVVSSNATNTTTGGTPIFKAGSDNFSLTATTTGVAANPSGYNGVMKINNSVMQVASPATVLGTLVGTFPAATPGTTASTATGSTFTYSEVGGFLLPGYPVTDTTSRRGVYDGVATVDECAGLTTAQCDALKAATWTGVDSVSNKGDCVADSYANTKDATGKYGCNFGLLANTAVIGRFVPDHFVLASGVIANRSDLTTCTPASTFTYMGEPMLLTLTIEAQNLSNVKTQNYVGSFAKLDGATASKWIALGSNDSLGLGAVDGTNALSARLAISGTPSGSWATGTGTLTAQVVFNRGASVDGAFDNLNLGIAPQDADGVKLLSGALNLDADLNAISERKQAATSKVRYGRIKFANAYGSQLLTLNLPLTLQYFNSGGWVTNALDSCSTLAANNFAYAFTGNLNACETAGTLTGSAPNLSLRLATPGNGNEGNADLALNLGTASAGNTCVAVGSAGPAESAGNQAWLSLPGGTNPTARATFGVYKGRNEFIYLRESY